MDMTIKIDDLEFGAQLNTDTSEMECLIEIIYPVRDGVDSRFVKLEDLKATLKFLETEVNR